MTKSASISYLFVRIGVAVVVQLLTENWWYGKEHIPGYLFYINCFRLKNDEVDEQYEKVWTQFYPWYLRIIINIALVVLVWLVNVKW